MVSFLSLYLNPCEISFSLQPKQHPLTFCVCVCVCECEQHVFSIFICQKITLYLLQFRKGVFSGYRVTDFYFLLFLFSRCSIFSSSTFYGCFPVYCMSSSPPLVTFNSVSLCFSSFVLPFCYAWFPLYLILFVR